MTADELEAAAGFVEHGHHLAMLLHRWKAGSARYSDFTYYCSKTTGLQRPRRANLAERRWRRLIDEVNSAFSDEAQARPRGDDE
jgi:hypothetical protein